MGVSYEAIKRVKGEKSPWKQRESQMKKHGVMRTGALGITCGNCEGCTVVGVIDEVKCQAVKSLKGLTGVEPLLFSGAAQRALYVTAH